MIVTMDQDTVQHERKVYDMLAFIGDCGGLFGGLTGLGSLFLSFFGMFGASTLETSLVKRIYREEHVET